MASHKRWLNEIAHKLEKDGWTFRMGGKHVRAYPADKTKKPITISISPSGWYGQNQAIRDLRRAGAKI